MAKPIKIVQANREVIESKLLVSLTDDSKVALIFGSTDVKLLIKALESLEGQEAGDMIDGLRKLHQSAFGRD